MDFLNGVIQELVATVLLSACGLFFRRNVKTFVNLLPRVQTRGTRAIIALKELPQWVQANLAIGVVLGLR